MFLSIEVQKWCQLKVLQPTMKIFWGQPNWTAVSDFLSRHSWLLVFCSVPRRRRGSPRIGMNTFLRPVSVCLCLLCPICLYPLKLKTNILQTTTKISEILHREQPEVHQLQVCIKATGTNIKISCRKPSSSVDGDLSMQQNGFVHRWWPSKQWFKQTPTSKQCFDPLWNKRSKRNIIFRFNHILKRTCYMFH